MTEAASRLVCSWQNAKHIIRATILVNRNVDGTLNGELTHSGQQHAVS